MIILMLIRQAMWRIARALMGVGSASMSKKQKTIVLSIDEAEYIGC